MVRARKARREREAANPEAVSRRHARYRERRSADPLRKEKRRSYAADWKRKHYARIKAEEAVRVDAMPEEVRGTVIAKRRAYHAEYARKQRVDAKLNDQNMYQKILGRVRSHRSKIALAELNIIGAQLSERLAQDDE